MVLLYLTVVALSLYWVSILSLCVDFPVHISLQANSEGETGIKENSQTQ